MAKQTSLYITKELYSELGMDTDNIQKNSIVAIETLKGELVASGNSLFSSDEILNLESGFAVNVSKVFMKTDIYPKMWK